MKNLIYATVILGAGVLLSVAMHSIANSGQKGINASTKGIVVSTQEVTKGDQFVVLKGWGQIQPKEQSQIAAQIAGKVTYIHPNAEHGDFIHQGDVLFRLESIDFEYDLIQAEAELALANAELEEEIALGKVAEEEWKTIDAHPTKLALRLPQLASAKAKVKGATAKVANAKLALSRTKIYAPYDAIVQNRNMGLGQTVEANQTVMQLYRADQAQVNVPISSFELSLLRESFSSNNRFEFANTSVQVSATHNSEIFTTGTLLRLNKTQNNKTRMTSLVVQISNLYNTIYHPELQFGSFVQVTIPRIRLHNVYKIPQHLIVNDAIWSTSAAKTLQKTHVNTIWEDDQYSYIRADLADSIQLVTSVPDYAKAGTPLTINNEAFANVETGAMQ